MNNRNRIHRIWKDMQIRCSEEYRKRYTSYKDVDIAEEWLIFENFYNDVIDMPFYDAKDHRGQYYSMDKDILGLELYSKDTVCFIPQDLNSFFTNVQSGSELPPGITFEKSRNKYKCRITKFGDRIHLGYFDNVDEAYSVYCDARNTYAKELAKYYEGQVEQRVVDALMKYDEEVWL